MGLVRLLQVSDLHLGRPFGWLPAERRQKRRDDQREALKRSIQEAIERAVHAIVIPGDLFDQEGVDADTLAFAVDVFHLAGCPPTFITPGNHDPCSPKSLFWNPRLLKARGREWPEHVHVFTEPRWTSKPLAETVRVWGRCDAPRTEGDDRPLARERLSEIPAQDSKAVEIAVFHGSREGHLPPGQKTVAPFSDDEIMSSPFTYLAVGHYHAASRFTPTSGPVAGVRLAYSGSAVALDTTEIGTHGALEVRIEYGHRQPFVEVEPVPLDSRQVIQVSVDVTGCASAERVDRRIARALDDASAAERDIVTVRLTGRLARDVRYEPARELTSRVFYLRIDRRGLRPDYPLETIRSHTPTTTDERFARALLERMESATDAQERARLERALYYGLDAFHLREVTPAHEEMESEAEGRA